MSSLWFDCAISVAVAASGCGLRLAILCLFLLVSRSPRSARKTPSSEPFTDPSGSVVTKAGSGLV